MKLLCFFCLSFALCGKVGYIDFVNGTAEFYQGSKWKPIKVGKKIKTGDSLRTGLQSSLGILLFDGSKFSLEENSVISVAHLEKQNNSLKARFKINQGEFLFNVQKLMGKEAFVDFETNTATAAIRGTIGGIEVEGENVQMYLHEGFLNISHASENFTINALEWAYLRKDNVRRETLSPEKLKQRIQKRRKLRTKLGQSIGARPNSNLIKIMQKPSSERTAKEKQELQKFRRFLSEREKDRETLIAKQKKLQVLFEKLKEQYPNLSDEKIKARFFDKHRDKQKGKKKNKK
jgi:hypothetical protein